MAFSRHNHFNRNRRPRDRERQPERPREYPGMHDLIDPEHTGSESDYLRSLVDSHATVTVMLLSGEQLKGHVRYYDRYCFSIGVSAKGPRFLIRKENVAYISES